MEAKELVEWRGNFLLIVDAQKDFIKEGAPMCVPDSKAKIEALDKWLADSKAAKCRRYEAVVMTADWHPADHCSFKEQGGPWPPHCVADTEGAEQWVDPFDVMNYLDCGDEEYHSCSMVIPKGQDKDREEYGADARTILDAFTDYDRVLFPAEALNRAHIDVVGIMSEYCVLETIRNLVDYITKKTMFPTLFNKIRLLLPFISTADDHKKLLEYAEANPDLIEVVREIR